jgi:hypothetical protein
LVKLAARRDQLSGVNEAATVTTIIKEAATKGLTSVVAIVAAKEVSIEATEVVSEEVIAAVLTTPGETSSSRSLRKATG